MALALSGCHNPVFDNEGDCEVTYGLRFVYDMNLDWADAFPTLVNGLDLYAFNSNGVFVKEYTLTESEISQPGYTMTLDLQPGKYTLVAWGWLENGITPEEAYAIPSMQPGVSKIEDLTCTLKTESNSEYSLYSDLMLPFLYHGNLDVDLPDSQDGRHYDYTMYLTKDTNHVRAIVQKINGDITTDDLDVRIEAANLKLNWDNTIASTETVTYLPWIVEDSIITSESNQGEEGNLYAGISADLMLSRFTDNMQKEVYLYVTDKESQETVFKVPVLQYALMAKSYYESAYNKTMTDGEYLDRQSEYFMTFFVDENINLRYTVLQVLSWRVVIHNYGVNY